MDARVGFESEGLPRRSVRLWKLPAFACLLIVFGIVYWKSQPPREFSGQYVGHLDELPLELRLGQSGSSLFGEGYLGPRRRVVKLTGTITNVSHFELHGTFESSKGGETILFVGQCSTHFDNNMPQVSGRCQLGQQQDQLPSRFVGRYFSPWCPPSVLKAEKH